MAQPVDVASKQSTAQVLEKFHANVTAPHIGHEYFESKQYLDLIPQHNPKWIFSPLNITSDEYDPSNLKQFCPPDINPLLPNTGANMFHPYYDNVLSALNLFKEWHNWKHSDNKKDANTWKSLKELNGLKSYWTYIHNEAISAVKSVMTVPYSVPIITGIVANDKHFRKYNVNIDNEEQLQNLSEYSLIWHCLVKKPAFFITPRDMLTVRFIYILPNCEVVIGETSIDSHPKDIWKNDHKYVRAHCTLNIWHIRPYYEGGNDSKHTHSLVTYYTHFRPNGAIPQWIVDQKIGEKAENPLTVKNYIDTIKDELHKKGVLHIPYPLLKMLKGLIVEDKKDEVAKDDDKKDIDENVVTYQKEVYGIDPTNQ